MYLIKDILEIRNCSLELLLHESTAILAEAPSEHFASLVEAVVLLHAIGILHA